MYSSVAPPRGSFALGWAFGKDSGLGTSAQAAVLLERSGLRPIIDGFPGGSLTEKLASGYEAAKTVLLQYTSTLKFSKEEAETVLFEIKGWADRNSDIIAEYMNDPASDTLPEQVALELGTKKAQQFVVAGFSEAARGLGPWLGGYVAGEVDKDPLLPEGWVKDDAHNRLVVFAAIMKMEADGDIEQIFRPEQWARKRGLSGVGLGMPPMLVAGIVVAVVVVVVSTVALVLYFAEVSEQNREHNKVAADICAKGAATNDARLLKTCENLMKPAGGFGDDLMTKIGKYVLIGGVIYTGAFVLLPMLTQRALTKKKLSSV